MKNLILCFSLFLVLASCEKNADIDVPQNPPMMAVACFLEDGRNFELRLEEVVPVFSKPKRNPTPIQGAMVIIDDGIQSDTLIEDLNIPGLYYSNSKQGIKGRSYTLFVNKTGFPNLSASCRIPDYLPGPINFDYVAVPDPDQGVDSLRRVNFSWMDQAGTQNYYRFDGMADFPPFGRAAIEFTNNNLADESRDGKVLQTGFSPFYVYNTGSPMNSLKVIFELMALDENSFKYMRTFDASYYSGDNPFAEPVIMFTNINGGIGIFGGVYRKFVTMQIY